MRIAVVSLFRDSSEQYIEEYFARAKSITCQRLEWFLVEGDSKNNTFDMLKSATKGDERFRVFRTRTGIPNLGSVIHESRFKCLARTANIAIDVISLCDFDYLWFVDSDLIYNPDLLSRLVDLDLDVVAPLFMAADAFYDIWGYRYLDGESVSPYTDWIKRLHSIRPIRLSTVGGCALFKHRFIAAGARMTETESIVGLCKECGERGAKVYLDPRNVVWHPIGGVANNFGIHMSKWGSSLPQS